MTKINPVSFKDLVRRLRDFEFEGPYSGGKHLYMEKGDIRLTLPNPHRKEIGVNLLIRILKQAGIKRKDWIKQK